MFFIWLIIDMEFFGGIFWGNGGTNETHLRRLK